MAVTGSAGEGGRLEAARQAAARVLGQTLGLGRAAGPEDVQKPDVLARLIESDIIPRLLMAHNSGAMGGVGAGAMAGGAASEADAIVTDAMVEGFAAAALSEEAGPLLERIEALLDGGVSVEVIYLQLLAPVARLLGQWWDDDACDFVDVTMGLWRIQQIVQAIAVRRPGVAVLPGAERSALFAPAPGEQHALGSQMVEEFFRRAGWQTWSAPALDEHELVALAAARSFDLVGLTVSMERHVTPLARTIAALRRTARNPRLIVLVGGRVLSERPSLAAEIGADGTAADGALAVQLAEDLLSAQTRQPVAGRGG
jgi:methanogenic corrinoid protein MtbC1